MASGAGVTPEVLVEGLEVPWDLAWAPDGDLFLTERTGRLRRFDGEEVRAVASPPDVIDAGAVDTDREGMQWWVEGGEGGLLGVAVHPTYPDPARVYVYYTYESGGERLNKVAYLDVAAGDPAATDHPRRRADPGERAPQRRADLVRPGELPLGDHRRRWGEGARQGRRATRGEGAPRYARGRSRAGQPGRRPRRPDLHLRPPQSPGNHLAPGRHAGGHRAGPGGRDEVNVLEAGADHGWSDVRATDEYRESDVARPVVNTGDDTWAPSGSVFYTGEAIPAWRNRLVVGGLVSQQVVVVTLTPADGSLPPAGGGWRSDADWLDDRYVATAHPALRDELGRVRNVAQGPDGALYALTSNRDGRAQGAFPRQRDDVLVRLTPA